jgi:hypothetical protein
MSATTSGIGFGLLFFLVFLKMLWRGIFDFYFGFDLCDWKASTKKMAAKLYRIANWQ